MPMLELRSPLMGLDSTVEVHGDESWTVRIFQLPDTFSELQPGTYAGLRRYTFHDPAVGGIRAGPARARGCNGLCAAR